MKYLVSNLTANRINLGGRLNLPPHATDVPVPEGYDATIEVLVQSNLIRARQDSGSLAIKQIDNDLRMPGTYLGELGETADGRWVKWQTLNSTPPTWYPLERFIRNHPTRLQNVGRLSLTLEEHEDRDLYVESAGDTFLVLPTNGYLGDIYKGINVGTGQIYLECELPIIKHSILPDYVESLSPFEVRFLGDRYMRIA